MQPTATTPDASAYNINLADERTRDTNLESERAARLRDIAARYPTDPRATDWIEEAARAEIIAARRAEDAEMYRARAARCHAAR